MYLSCSKYLISSAGVGGSVAWLPNRITGFLALLTSSTHFWTWSGYKRGCATRKHTEYTIPYPLLLQQPSPNDIKRIELFCVATHGSTILLSLTLTYGTASKPCETQISEKDLVYLVVCGLRDVNRKWGHVSLFPGPRKQVHHMVLKIPFKENQTVCCHHQ